MMSVRNELTPEPDSSGRSDWAGLPLYALWLVLMVYSFVHAPVPGVNEPQQLGKAKRYWQPDWCEGDFFLDSTDAHLFFYVTVGALNRWFTLSTTAVIGRVLAWLLLAIAWNRVAIRLTEHRWGGVGSAVIFLALASIGNLSGEWLVGGVEGKVFSYAFVLLAFSSAMEKRWIATGIQLGLAIAMHPLVGLWTVIAASMSALAGRLAGSQSRSNDRLQPEQNPSRAADTPASSLSADRQRSALLIGLVLMISIGAIGVVPALSAVGGATPKAIDTANYIQVFFRLRHHLDPMLFGIDRFVAYGILGVACWWIVRHQHGHNISCWLGRFVAAAGLIAFVGLLLGAGPRPPETMPLWAFRASLLKFYPFRLVDVMLPLVLSLLVMRHVARRLVQIHGRRLRFAAGLLIGVALFVGAGTGTYIRPADWKRDWVDVCNWIRVNLPDDALVMTPSEAYAFKWYSDRAEFVTKKDCPQDTPGIIEWNDRLNLFSGWADDAYADSRYTAEETKLLHERTGITHIVTRHLGPFEKPPIYRNETYSVQKTVSE